ncbi:MAG: hypothetical protein HRT45_13170 [Bdellovibrionales bacterium]|nr:hypothetical protein [Bdellovibrionales bacterium]
MEASKTSSTLFWQKLAGAACFALAAAAVLISTSPSMRNHFRSKYFRPNRKVLSIVTGNLLNDGQIVKAVKYKTVTGVVIEILGSGQNGARSLIDTITIPGEHDGFFNFRGGNATQLAVIDVDDDGSFELMAPTFDDQLVAHLNIYKYNPIRKVFLPVKDPD